MSATTLVWLVTAVAFVALLGLAAMQVLRALRDLQRAKARVNGYGRLPVVTALNRAQADAARLQASVAGIAPLAARAQAARATIGRGPVPPELPAAFAHVRRALIALREVRR